MKDLGGCRGKGVEDLGVAGADKGRPRGVTRASHCPSLIKGEEAHHHNNNNNPNICPAAAIARKEEDVATIR
ncbi:unnamed protein product [Lactuca virosa]|uniref:Uncharacterized protein n=1 Tax=Lactuca virosa TaxID=75947 RepID=A0AAU9PIW4_9ASTR|nr:unnamed protein product [Lactuca virosa]